MANNVATDNSNSYVKKSFLKNNKVLIKNSLESLENGKSIPIKTDIL